jgi:hypothetical protein
MSSDRLSLLSDTESSVETVLFPMTELQSINNLKKSVESKQKRLKYEMEHGRNEALMNLESFIQEKIQVFQRNVIAKVRRVVEAHQKEISFHSRAHKLI